MEPITVLFTGGPGAGKSSALATLRDRLTKRGFQALLVPETATTLLENSGGYDLAWHGTPKHTDLQEIFMKFQKFQEDTFRSVSKLRDTPAVILHDRGLLDGRQFCTDEEWAESLRRLETTDEELLKRYDLVIHMTTVASGMEGLYDYGPGSTNPSRHHTPEQARDADVRAQEIYSKHPQVRVVPNFPAFADKIETVVSYVFEALHVDGLAGPRERSVIKALGDVDSISWPVEHRVYEFKITFLDKEFTESVRRQELLQSHGDDAAHGAPPTVLYEYRKEMVKEGRPICTRRVLSAEAYELLRTRKADAAVDVGKRAICFSWNGVYYELLSYSEANGEPLSDHWGLHGYHVLDQPEGAAMPDFLEKSRLKNAGNQENISPEKSEKPVVEEASKPSTMSPPSCQKRSLTRRTTVEAAASVDNAQKAFLFNNKRLLEQGDSPLRKRLKTPPCSSLKSVSDLLNSPSLSKAAAVVMQCEP